MLANNGPSPICAAIRAPIGTTCPIRARPIYGRIGRIPVAPANVAVTSANVAAVANANAVAVGIAVTVAIAVTIAVADRGSRSRSDSRSPGIRFRNSGCPGAPDPWLPVARPQRRPEPPMRALRRVTILRPRRRPVRRYRISSHLFFSIVEA